MDFLKQSFFGFFKLAFSLLGLGCTALAFSEVVDVYSQVDVNCLNLLSAGSKHFSSVLSFYLFAVLCILMIGLFIGVIYSNRLNFTSKIVSVFLLIVNLGLNVPFYIYFIELTNIIPALALFGGMLLLSVLTTIYIFSELDGGFEENSSFGWILILYNVFLCLALLINVFVYIGQDTFKTVAVEHSSSNRIKREQRTTSKKFPTERMSKKYNKYLNKKCKNKIKK